MDEKIIGKLESIRSDYGGISQAKGIVVKSNSFCVGVPEPLLGEIKT